VASVNRVFLIGVVATPPVERAGAYEFLLGVPEERSGTAWLERVCVTAAGHLAETVRGLRSARAVYVDGRLVRSPDGAVVEASALFPIGDAPPDRASHEGPTASHASPRPHDRAGHPRRLHPGTPRERVVWVRPTRVGDPTTRPRSRRRR